MVARQWRAQTPKQREQREQRGRMLIRGAGALPPLLSPAKAVECSHPGTEKQEWRGGPQLLSRQGPTVTNTSPQNGAPAKPVRRTDPLPSTEVLAGHQCREAAVKPAALGTRSRMRATLLHVSCSWGLGTHLSSNLRQSLECTRSSHLGWGDLICLHAECHVSVQRLDGL